MAKRRSGRKSKAARARSAAAKKGWATRKAAARARSAAAKKSAATRGNEKAQIEKLLGEEFESLREARAALKREAVPVAAPAIKPEEVTSAAQYFQAYDEWEDYYDFYDAGEFDAGVDY